MAFKCGRDTYAFTSRRMLLIDVKGMSGKMIRYTSYLWSSIKAFAVQTPGAFIDRDCEITLWNGISHVAESEFSMDLRCAAEKRHPPASSRAFAPGSDVWLTRVSGTPRPTSWLSRGT